MSPTCSPRADLLQNIYPKYASPSAGMLLLVASSRIHRRFLPDDRIRRILQDVLSMAREFLHDYQRKSKNFSQLGCGCAVVKDLVSGFKSA